jgi:hypothetical protein
MIKKGSLTFEKSKKELDVDFIGGEALTAEGQKVISNYIAQTNKTRRQPPAIKKV